MDEKVTQDDRIRRHPSGTAKATVLGVLVFAGCLFNYGPSLLTSSDPLPSHVEAAVVLQGSVAAGNVRLAGAMHLVQTGVASRIVLSVPRETYWGEPSIPAARRYMQRTYGDAVEGRLEFCETGPEVNSTEEEAKEVSSCLREHGWPTVAVVTSNYHTRRAGMIWREVTRASNPAARIWMYGVKDPEFDDARWWRSRTSAKTTFLESTKMIWNILTNW